MNTRQDVPVGVLLCLSLEEVSDFEVLFRICIGTFYLKLIQERRAKGWAAPCTNWCYQFGYSLQIVALIKYP